MKLILLLCEVAEIILVLPGAHSLSFLWAGKEMTEKHSKFTSH